MGLGSKGGGRGGGGVIGQIQKGWSGGNITVEISAYASKFPSCHFFMKILMVTMIPTPVADPRGGGGG